MVEIHSYVPQVGVYSKTPFMGKGLALTSQRLGEARKRGFFFLGGDEIRYHEIRHHVSMIVDVSSHNTVNMSPMYKTTVVSHVPASIKVPDAVSGSLFLVNVTLP